MPTKIHRKLVRDRIPRIIVKDGGTPKIRTLSSEGFKDALLKKLVEEATEARDANNIKELMDELADLDEVRLAILAAYNIDPGELEQLRKKRARQRGAFTLKTFLESVKTK